MLKKFFILIFIPIIFVAVVNIAIDPYALWGTKETKGFNDLKDGVRTNARITKAFAVWRIKPKNVIIGSSRSESGLSPYHPGWKSSSVYNLAVSNAHIYETRRYLQHAAHLAHINRVVYGVDFYTFNANRELSAVFREDLLSVSPGGKRRWFPLNELLGSTLSFDSLKASWATLHPDPSKYNYYSDRGQQMGRVDAVSSRGQRIAFLECEKDYILYVWKGIDSVKRYKGDALTYSFSNGSQSSFEEFRKIVHVCLKNKIKADFFISPVHFRYLVALHMAGLLETYFEWERRLVEIIRREEAAYPDAPRIRVWDFAIRNQFTDEAVPPLEDTTTRMHWYYETSHYTQAYGDMILDALLLGKDHYMARGHLYQRISTINVEENIKAVRKQVHEWIDSHPSDYRELQEYVERADPQFKFMGARP